MGWAGVGDGEIWVAGVKWGRRVGKELRRVDGGWSDLEGRAAGTEYNKINKNT